MPAERLVDPRTLDPSRPLFGRDEIRSHNQQRFEMEMLDGILLHDEERRLIAGFYEVRADAWWARGHFPGRPMLPGVLSLEAGHPLCDSMPDAAARQPGPEGFGAAQIVALDPDGTVTAGADPRRGGVAQVL